MAKIESYFVEFEFKTNNGNSYWLPLFIKCGTLEHAESWLENISLAIENKCEVLRKNGPVPIIEGFNSKYRHDYVKNGMLFTRRAKLRIDVFDLVDLEYCEGKTYDEHMEIVEAKPEDYMGKILANGQSFCFPVTVLDTAEDAKYEFLTFDVVQPK